MRTLSARGYRVSALDQIGFDKSSKPEIRDTFAMLADNTVRVLDHLKVGRVAIGELDRTVFGRCSAPPERFHAAVLELLADQR